MAVEYVVFFLILGIGLLAFTFHEIDEKSRDVLLTAYSKVDLLIERRLYKALMMKGYYLTLIREACD